MSSSLTERAISLFQNPSKYNYYPDSRRTFHMVWYVYILENAAGLRYVGYTGREPQVRLREHNDGLNRWTRAHRPWRLLASEPCANKAEAIRRERYLKTGAGRRERDRLADVAQG